jgi:Rieske Fe-S protein
VTIDRETQIIVVRFQQRAYAFNLACPHENTALRWKERDGRFQCPRHESQYQPDGTFISGRATRKMDRFAIKRAGDRLVVDLDRLFRSDQQAQAWGAAAVSL